MSEIQTERRTMNRSGERVGVRVAFNRFPDFFLYRHLKLLKTLANLVCYCYTSYDWPIFMISGSNQQLQQQLEYTLLKPDCHSWWISKIQSDILEERYQIKFCFKLGKNTTETYGMLQTAFGASCMNRASVFEWHKRFKEGRETMRDVGGVRKSEHQSWLGKGLGLGLLCWGDGSSGRDSVRRGLAVFKSGLWHLPPGRMHQSTTPSLSLTIWPR